MTVKFMGALAISWFSGTLLAQVPAAAPPGTPIPARAFARFPTFHTVRMSPDGRYLATSARVGAEFALLVYTLPERKLVSGLRLQDDRVIGGINWTSNQRLIIQVGIQEGAADAVRLNGEIFAVNADGTDKRYLYGFDGQQGTAHTRIKMGAQAEQGFALLENPLPDVPGSALISVTTDTQSTVDGRYYQTDSRALYRIDVMTARRQRVDTPELAAVEAFFADASGRVRLVSGTRGSEYYSKPYWQDAKQEWQPVNIAAERLHTLRVSRDGRRAYFLAAQKGNQSCLMEWAFPESPAAAAPGKELLCKPATELQYVYFTADDRPYAYASGSQARVSLIDEKPIEAQVLTSLQTQFPEQIVYLADATRDHQRLLFYIYSDHNSGEYYAYDAATNQANFLFAAQSWLDPALMASVRPIEYPARDGLKIEGFLTLPNGKPAKNLPMVVLPHGGPIGVSDGWQWDADAQFLANRGYAVLQVNFRGSGGYGTDFEKAGFGEWGGKMIDDISDGTRWVVQQGIADGKRLCIFGASYGGYAALMSVVREPDLYRCAIAYAGVYDLNRLVKDSDAANSEGGRAYFGDSIAKTETERARQSPLTYIDQLKAQLMIVHGEDDIRVPINQAELLRSALQKRNYPYDWLTKRDEGHGFFNEDNRVELYEKLAAFLEKNIGK